MRPRSHTANAKSQVSAAYWSTLTDEQRANHTIPGRSAFLAKFEAMVPAEITDPDERAAKAEELRREHFRLLGQRSGEARRKNRSRTLRRRALALLEQAEGIEAGDAR